MLINTKFIQSRSNNPNLTRRPKMPLPPGRNLSGIKKANINDETESFSTAILFFILFFPFYNSIVTIEIYQRKIDEVTIIKINLNPNSHKGK